MEFRVCLVQMPCVEGDREKNFERVRFLTYDLDTFDGPQFIVLPELFDIGFQHEDYESAGTGFPGPTSDFLREYAEEKESYVIATGIEKGLTKYYNTLAMTDPKGEILGTYRKMHPFQAERDVFDGGDKIVLFDVAEMRVGVQICYDIRFPEVTRRLAIEGAELVIVPAAWPDPRAAHWDSILLARAIENQIYIAATNRVGQAFDKKTYFGHSQLIDPWGVRLTRMNSEERIVVDTGDTDSLKSVRDQITVWQDRSQSGYDKVKIFKE